MHQIHVLSISVQSTRNQTVQKFTKCQYNLCGIYIYLCAVLSISAQSPRNRPVKSLQNVNTISAAYTSISVPYYQSLCILRGIKLKKSIKCQYNLCSIYIYLCAVLSISAQSPRNRTVKSLQNVNTISAAYTSISVPYYQSLHILQGIKLKKFMKCQYKICSIYIYLCAVLSISEGYIE